MAVTFKGAHFPPAGLRMGVALVCVAYPLNTRHIDELLAERGVQVDHSTMTRWVVKDSPQLDAAFHRRHRPGEAAGAWTKRISVFKGSGCISIGPSINRDNPLTSFSPPDGTGRSRSGF